MTIELNKTEIELLDKAMQSWETEPAQTALMQTMVKAMLCRREDQDETKEECEKDLAKGTVETQDRRRTSTLLRAKLIQALNRESEFPAHV